MSSNQGVFSKLKPFLLLVSLLAVGGLAWVFTPLSTWLMPPNKTIITQPNKQGASLLYDEQTKRPLNQYPPQLQGLDNQWRKQLKTETQQALYFEDNSGGAFLKAVEGTLLNPQGQVVGKFKAPYGSYNAKTQVIHLQGGIQFQGLASR